MDNPLIGKFFLIAPDSDHCPHGKAQIVSHLSGEYYLTLSYDLCSKFPDFMSILSLADMRKLPLFESEDALDLFFSQIAGEEPVETREVSH